MAEFSSHAPGTFSGPSWPPPIRKRRCRFYRALFGWDVNDQPIGPTETYSMFQMRGKEIGAAYTMRPDERQHGRPAALELVRHGGERRRGGEEGAKTLGAKVLAPPFDVMDCGTDGGAAGSDRRGVPGLAAEAAHRREDSATSRARSAGPSSTRRDTKAAEAFYTQLFGWTPKHSPRRAAWTYTEFSVGGTPSIGMMPMNDQMMPHERAVDTGCRTSRSPMSTRPRTRRRSSAAS